MALASALVAALLHICLAAAQQQCYYGPGAALRANSQVVPCQSTGQSACCLLGDTCFSGNVCYNYASGNLYQYGCTDITFQDSSCPFKCGFDPSRSPWVGLEFCQDVPNVNNTWVCHAPESCGCDWHPDPGMVNLAPRGCSAMGSMARVALYAPSVLAPYISLPATQGGSTGYYSTLTLPNVSTTWVSTAISGYTPTPIVPLTTYTNSPNVVVHVAGLRFAEPAPSTVAAASPTASSVAGTASPGSSSGSSSGSSASSSTPAPSSDPSPPAPAPGGGSLSAGAKAGIGVGAGVGGLAVICAMSAFIMWHRRRSRALQMAHPQMFQQSPHPDWQHASYQQSPPMQRDDSYRADSSKGGWQQASPHSPPPGHPPQYMYGAAHQPPAHFTSELSSDEPIFEIHSQSNGELPRIEHDGGHQGSEVAHGARSPAFT